MVAKNVTLTAVCISLGLMSCGTDPSTVAGLSNRMTSSGEGVEVNSVALAQVQSDLRTAGLSVAMARAERVIPCLIQTNETGLLLGRPGDSPLCPGVGDIPPIQQALPDLFDVSPELASYGVVGKFAVGDDFGFDADPSSLELRYIPFVSFIRIDDNLFDNREQARIIAYGEAEEFGQSVYINNLSGLFSSPTGRIPGCSRGFADIEDVEGSFIFISYELEGERLSYLFTAPDLEPSDVAIAGATCVIEGLGPFSFVGVGF